MLVVILGASGQTGQLLVKECLDAGHDVTAVVRTPDNITTTHDKLKVVEADVFSTDSLAPHLASADAVMSCLAFATLFKNTTLYSDSMKSILAAMKQSEAKRLISASSWYTEAPHRSNISFFIRQIIVPMLSGMWDDIQRMEDLAKAEDGVNYTFVKAKQLVNKPASGDDHVSAEEGDFNNNSGILGKVPRANLAHFMFQCLTDDKWDKKRVAMGVTA